MLIEIAAQVGSANEAFELEVLSLLKFALKNWPLQSEEAMDTDKDSSFDEISRYIRERQAAITPQSSARVAEQMAKLSYYWVLKLSKGQKVPEEMENLY